MNGLQTLSERNKYIQAINTYTGVSGEALETLRTEQLKEFFNRSARDKTGWITKISMIVAPAIFTYELANRNPYAFIFLSLGIASMLAVSDSITDRKKLTEEITSTIVQAQRQPVSYAEPS